VSAGRVLFVGCGPGAPDLLTVRAVRALERADVIVWSPSLLDREALGVHARADAEIVAWPPATERDILDVYDRALEEDLVVVRLKGGDPMLLGRMEPELSAVLGRGLACEVVPGVNALAASAAALALEVAAPDAPLLIADASSLGASPGCIAVYGAGRDPLGLQRELLGRGLAASAACVVASEVSRPGETLISCPLADLAETLDDYGRGRITLVLAGPPDARPPQVEQD
jgi:precorrin-4/cobalt-precorrin-4 C11-methyltransferase